MYNAFELIVPNIPPNIDEALNFDLSEINNVPRELLLEYILAISRYSLAVQYMFNEANALCDEYKAQRDMKYYELFANIQAEGKLTDKLRDACVRLHPDYVELNNKYVEWNTKTKKMYSMAERLKELGDAMKKAVSVVGEP